MRVLFVLITGNVCGGCKKKIDPSDLYIANVALENVLKNLSFPCRYQANGCKERTEHWNLQTHQAKCVFRDYTCPMFYFGDCAWRGHSSLILKHFEECHPNNVEKQGRNNCMNLEVNNGKNCVYTVLFLTKFEKFLLHAKCDTAACKIFYRIFYVGDPEKASAFQCVIEQKGCANSTIKFETHLPVLPDTEFSKDFNAETSLSFDFAFLQPIIKDTNCLVSSIRIIPPNSENQELDEKLLNYFECPVCSHFMKPPIFQCLSGHSICNYCRPKVVQCPSCRANFGATRNYTLEDLSNGVHYPCIYRDLGCQTVMLSANIVKHELECPLRPYTCPLKDVILCHWEGTHSSITTHLKACHSEKVKFTNYLRTTLLFSFDHVQYDVYCMVSFGEVFRVWFRHDIGEQNGYWAVQLVGSKGKAKNFKYEIGLIDPKNEERMLIRTDLCHEITNQFNIFTNCAVPVSIISGFAAGGHMIYFCRITKIDKSERR